MAQWYEALMAQALLINMHEYFSGQVIFQLHPVCDAMYYIENSSTGAPFQMRQVEEICFWNIHHHPIWRLLL